MKISVLVPTLGTREKEIRRLLETLEKQSYKDFEIIFVTQDNHEILKDIIDDTVILDIVKNHHSDNSKNLVNFFKQIDDKN